MRSFSTSECTGCSSPSLSASQMRPASTVRKMSAGLFAPSACIRAIISSGVPSIRFTVIPWPR